MGGQEDTQAGNWTGRQIGSRAAEQAGRWATVARKVGSWVGRQWGNEVVGQTGR